MLPGGLPLFFWTTVVWELPWAAFKLARAAIAPAVKGSGKGFGRGACTGSTEKDGDGPAVGAEKEGRCEGPVGAEKDDHWKRDPSSGRPPAAAKARAVASIGVWTVEGG